MRGVLVSGKQGSGKSTVQKLLMKTAFEQYGMKVLELNFADPLYVFHNYILNKLEGWGIPKVGAKDGPLLQVLGTEWGRNTRGEDFWVKLLQNRAKIAKANGTDLVVVGDCRFPNELSALPGALKVRLECDREIRKKRCSMWRENDVHPSEVSLDFVARDGGFDMYFNSGVITPEQIVKEILLRLTEGMSNVKEI